MCDAFFVPSQVTRNQLCCSASQALLYNRSRNAKTERLLTGCLARMLAAQGPIVSEAWHTGFSGIDGGCNCLIELLLFLSIKGAATSLFILNRACWLRR